MADWDPQLYLRYADERGRPFFDLLAQVDATAPATVADLGCGPGNLTATLTHRWPGARVIGVDSSPAMIERAAAVAGIEATVADLVTWRPDAPLEVIVSNAALQWIPDHQRLLPDLVSMLAPGGWLAYQVPRNFDQPNHRLLRELSADPRFAEHLTGVARTEMASTAQAMEILSGLDCRVQAWETTYLHVLQGEDPVFEWISSTGARPTLDRLPEPLRTEFVDDYKAALRSAYPRRSLGTVLPFPRAFVVAQRN